MFTTKLRPDHVTAGVVQNVLFLIYSYIDKQNPTKKQTLFSLLIVIIHVHLLLESPFDVSNIFVIF